MLQLFWLLALIVFCFFTFNFNLLLSEGEKWSRCPTARQQMQIISRPARLHHSFSALLLFIIPPLTMQSDFHGCLWCSQDHGVCGCSINWTTWKGCVCCVMFVPECPVLLCCSAGCVYSVHVGESRASVAVYTCSHFPWNKPLSVLLGIMAQHSSKG